VERGSDKHSPMIDEALKHDTASLLGGSPSESRSQEGREQEGPAEGEPTPDARLSGDPWLSGDTLSLDDANARADLARHLDRAVFPARPGELVENARARHAPEDVVSSLSALPDRLYDTIGEVWAALGGKIEGGHANLP